jgi:hypothetical protein
MKLFSMPVVLFAYTRHEHLLRTLACLRRDGAQLLYAFSDGPKTPKQEEAVGVVRRTLREIDWCDCILTEKETNLGLGRSVLSGVSKVLEKESSVLVFEDDLICAPGTLQYLSSAMDHYKEDPRVMSVTGWTHPRITPNDVVDQPYFDGRAECWVWGTWARAWKGMGETARSLMTACEKLGIDVYRYGADLPQMAELELDRNIWAVRFLYFHILHGGLCLRPPHSLVEHIGFDTAATNATAGDKWPSAPLKACPQIPDRWPEPIENLVCPRIWQKAYGKRRSRTRSILHALHKVMKGVKKTGELVYHRQER